MPKDTGKIKRAKDPNAPTRPQSAYLLWSQKHRQQLKEQEPNLSFGELGKKLGEIWQSMDPSDKKPWIDEAEKLKEIYESKQSKYMKTPEYHEFQSSKAVKAGKKAGKPAKEKGPKRPMTSFMAFSKYIRPVIVKENPNFSFAQIGKAIGERWAKLSPVDKMKYEEMSDNDRKRYDKEVEEAKEGKAASHSKAGEEDEDDDDDDDDEDE